MEYFFFVWFLLIFYLRWIPELEMMVEHVPDKILLHRVQIPFVSDLCRKFRRRTNARWGHVGLNKSRPRRTGGERVDRAWN